jgi:hypothetical protein
MKPREAGRAVEKPAMKDTAAAAHLAGLALSLVITYDATITEQSKTGHSHSFHPFTAQIAPFLHWQALRFMADKTARYLSVF